MNRQRAVSRYTGTRSRPNFSTPHMSRSRAIAMMGENRRVSAAPPSATFTVAVIVADMHRAYASARMTMDTGWRLPLFSRSLERVSSSASSTVLL